MVFLEHTAALLPHLPNVLAPLGNPTELANLAVSTPEGNLAESVLIDSLVMLAVVLLGVKLYKGSHRPPLFPRS